MSMPLARACALAALLAGCNSGSGSFDAADGSGGTNDAEIRPDPDIGERRDAAPIDDAADQGASPTDAGDGGPPGDALVPADTAPPDAAPLDLGRVHDGTPLPAPAEPPAPLFDPDAEGASEHDAPLAQVVEAWRARPTDEASARARERSLREALTQLREGGARAADRVVEICRAAPEATHRRLVCLRLLSYVESRGSLAYLAELGTAQVPPWPEGAHPLEPPPAGLARQVAIWALGRRARAGSEAAVGHLLRIVAAPQGGAAPGADPDDRARSLAVEAVFGALPRLRAKARLKAVLPDGELYRLYEVR